jgi:membrane associated rhomboid family serine protease
MNTPAHNFGRELKGIVAFVGVIWVVFLVDWLLPARLTEYGLVPRTLFGSMGIATMPFLHAGLGHILGNTLPLAILLVLLVGSKARSWEAVVEIVVAGGVLLWLFGQNATHVGASGLVFGLAVFLIVSGLLERRILSLFVAFVVVLLYGGTLFWGVLPSADSKVSWDGHLCGAIAGGLLAWALTRSPKR